MHRGEIKIKTSFFGSSRFRPSFGIPCVNGINSENKFNQLKDKLNDAIQQNDDERIKRCLTDISNYLKSNKDKINDPLTTGGSTALMVAALFHVLQARSYQSLKLVFL